jgi:hypothetical protein
VRRSRLLIAAVVLAVLATAGLTAWPAAAGATDPAPDPRCQTRVKPSQVLIFGDSMTSRVLDGRNRGHRAWWQWGLVGKKGTFRFSASGKSRYAKVLPDDLPTMYERLGDILTKKPRVVVIAGGFAEGNKRDARAAVAKFYRQLEVVARRAKLPTCNIYAFVVRPTYLSGQIPGYVKKGATSIGAQYVNVPGFSRALSYDGIHPSTRGARTVWQSIARGSDLDDRLR